MATVGVVAGLVGLAAYMYGPATNEALTRFGVFRELTSTPLTNPDEFLRIKDTTHCEDLHYYAPADTLFTACEDTSATRFKWFPPLTNYGDANLAWNAKGSIHTINPEVRFQIMVLGVENHEQVLNTYVEMIRLKSRNDWHSRTSMGHL